MLIQSPQGYFNRFLERDISVQTVHIKGDYTLVRVQLSFLQDLPGHLSVRFYVCPLNFIKVLCQVLFRLSYKLPGKERTARSGVPCLCTFASPYSLAGCAPASVYSASLISSFFFMASNSLFRSFSIFIITLSVRFFLSLNSSAWYESFSFSCYVSFFITQKPTSLSNGTARRPLYFKYFLAFSTPLSSVYIGPRSNFGQVFFVILVFFFILGRQVCCNR